MIWLLFLVLLVVGLSGLLGGIGATIFLLLVAATAIAGIIMLLRGRRSVEFSRCASTNGETWEQILVS